MDTHIQRSLWSLSFCILVSHPHPAKLFTSSVLLCISRHVFVYCGSQIVLLSLHVWNTLATDVIGIYCKCHHQSVIMAGVFGVERSAIAGFARWHRSGCYSALAWTQLCGPCRSCISFLDDYFFIHIC